jgi:RimJ/RimL family protein N-acetyltransferase
VAGESSGSAASRALARSRAAGRPGYAAAVVRRFDRIQTARLVLRRWRDQDRDDFAAMNSDPEVMRYFPSTIDRAASDRHVDQIEQRFDSQGFGLWALEVTATGAFIGYTGLNPMPEGTPGAGDMEVGWRLAALAWHHGYATEAATAAVDVGFSGAGLPRIWSMTSVLNLPSLAVMRRLGMTSRAHFDHPAIPVGSPLRRHVAYLLERPDRL